ncbi:MAG: DsrE family protein [Candidatus Glassbacteria bacterium]|nr:DsrE family protein [Candidatus Glassbacteria bacterium]
MEKHPTSSKQPLVIFAHSDGYDRLFQVASLALTAAHSGRPVTVVFFFQALHAYVTGRMDELSFSCVSQPAAEELKRRICSGNQPPPSEMLRLARETGLVRLYACSASVQYTGLELEQAASAVDEVVGMATILRLTLDGPNLIYI